MEKVKRVSAVEDFHRFLYRCLDDRFSLRDYGYCLYLRHPRTGFLDFIFDHDYSKIADLSYKSRRIIIVKENCMKIEGFTDKDIEELGESLSVYCNVYNDYLDNFWRDKDRAKESHWSVVIHEGTEKVKCP